MLGQTLLLEDDTIELGRGDPATTTSGRISFAEPTISHVQAWLKWDAAKRMFFIHPHTLATNPTCIARKPLKKPVAVKHGEEVQMGHLAFVLEYALVRS